MKLARLAKILLLICPISLAIAFACEMSADWLMKKPEWAKSRTVSLMLDSTRAIATLGFVCLIGSFFTFLSIRVGRKTDEAR